MSRIRIYRSLPEVPSNFGPCALSIGNFDGVHAGHRRILRRVSHVAREHGWQASVMTFEPHPTKVVAPARSPRLMTTPEERCVMLAAEGIQQALILPFTGEVARLSPEEFVAHILVEWLRVRAVLVGDNFHFGYRQAGNTQTLSVLGGHHGFTTEIIPAVRIRGIVASSSAVRHMVEAGNVARAARLLERPYALSGNVISGRGIGSQRTVPTLNLAPESEVLPATGVYITETNDLDAVRCWPSVTNIGYRPTFDDGSALSIETFLLADPGGAAPRRIRVDFLRRLRDERKFECPEALKAQILRDVARARAYFRRLRSWTGRTKTLAL
jgi:riboflavin kinase/FMN adenylyltransferase